MSVNVLAAVLRESDARGFTRLVALVLADAAGADGIVWLEQERIAERARVDVRQVRREIRKLEALGELETRQAQRGRRRLNVYRVAMGAEVPQYERLPFEIGDPFSDDRTVSPVVTTGLEEHDDRTESAATTGLPRVRDLEDERKGERKEHAAGSDEPPASRPPDLIWDELERLFGAVAPKTNARARRNKAVVDLRRMGADVEGIRRAHRAYSRVFTGAACTDIALATHYPQLSRSSVASPSAPVDADLAEPLTEEERRENAARARELAAGIGRTW